MEKNIFIVFDGIDGSGKSALIEMLYKYLSSKDKEYRLLKTREPTNGKYGKQIRKMLRKEKDPMSNNEKLMELFTKDRHYHLEKEINPFLGKLINNRRNIVLCDRYYYSTIAFQSAQGLNIKDIIERNRKFRKPDVAFILDIEPSLALKRIEFRKKEKFEQLEFMKTIRKNFLRLPRLLDDNLKIIDASKPLSDVFEKIKIEVNRLLN